MRKFVLLVVMCCTVTLGNLFADANPDSLTEIPEPATIGLMGAGLAAIGVAAWRRGRKQ